MSEELKSSECKFYVTGATGWVGRTFLHELQSIIPPQEFNKKVFAFGSKLTTIKSTNYPDKDLNIDNLHRFIYSIWRLQFKKMPGWFCQGSGHDPISMFAERYMSVQDHVINDDDVIPYQNFLSKWLCIIFFDNLWIAYVSCIWSEVGLVGLLADGFACDNVTCF